MSQVLENAEAPDKVPTSSVTTAVDWQKRCQELAAECDNLRKELVDTTRERDIYLQSVYALSHKELDFDKEAILSCADTQQDLKEFIAELERKPGV